LRADLTGGCKLSGGWHITGAPDICCEGGPVLPVQSDSSTSCSALFP